MDSELAVAQTDVVDRPTQFGLAAVLLGRATRSGASDR
jgi:hypothetical protein